MFSARNHILTILLICCMLNTFDLIYLYLDCTQSEQSEKPMLLEHPTLNVL